MKDANEAKEAYDMIKQFWQRHSGRLPSSPLTSSPNITRRISNAIETPTTEVNNILPQTDWDMMLKGAKTSTLPEGHTLIQQNEEFQRIFQITRGICRIEVNHIPDFC